MTRAVFHMLIPDPRRDTIRFRLAAAAGALTAALLVAAAALAVMVGARRRADREIVRAARDQASYAARLILEQTIHFTSGALDLMLFAASRDGRVVPTAPESLLARLRWSESTALMDTTFRDSLRTAFTHDVRSARTEWVMERPIGSADSLRMWVLRQAEKAVRGPSPRSDVVSTWLAWKGEDVTLWLFVDRDASGAPRTINGVTYSRRPFFSAYIPLVLSTVPILPASVSGGRWDLSDPRKAIELQRNHVAVRLTNLASHQVEYDTGDLAHEGAAGEYTLESEGHGYRARVGLADTLTDLLEADASTGIPEWALWGLICVAVLLACTAIAVAARAFAGMNRRQRFLAAVSHELRTPLTQVRLSVDTLRRLPGDGDERRSRTVEALDRGTEQLTRTVENLLALAKSDLPTWRVRPRATDIEALVRNAVETMSPLAATRQVTFDIIAASPVWAMVDPDAFRQVILNLLDNAIKYGPRGQSVRVRLNTYRDTAEVSITDRGPGIPDSARERIWNAFERATGDRIPERDGLGLGLSVVRDIIDRHGGWVRLEDGAAGGSTFVVGVPAADPSDAVPSTSEYPIVSNA